jgi:antitoxin (DNA-binding transcriptional repressor) of toxin-antitoxin stability system
MDVMWLDMAMIRVGVAELKNNLSKHLRLVEGGEVIEVTDHHRAIAMLVPIEVKSRLVVRPALRPFSEIAHKVYPPRNEGVDYVEMLLEDRQRR